MSHDRAARVVPDGEETPSHRGLFITLEGPEGAGKSTQLLAIGDYLRDTGKEVVLTREPGGSELGERVRAILLDRGQEGIATDAELLLLFAARAEHLDKLIMPALERGACVVCDRFTDASYAYQGGGRGVPVERIAALEEWVQGKLRPDLTFVFDLPVELGLQRIAGRGAKDRFEAEGTAFFERVRAEYLRRARCNASRYSIIDATGDVERVRGSIREVLRSRLHVISGFSD